MAKVAFLELGVMGYPMAGHLKNKGGHEVTVYNRTAAKAEKWVGQHQGRSANTPKSAAEGAGFHHVLRRQRPRLARGGARPEWRFCTVCQQGAVFVDHTTASAETARELLRRGASRRGFELRRRAGLGRPGRRRERHAHDHVRRRRRRPSRAEPVIAVLCAHRASCSVRPAAAS